MRLWPRSPVILPLRRAEIRPHPPAVLPLSVSSASDAAPCYSAQHPMLHLRYSDFPLPLPTRSATRPWLGRGLGTCRVCRAPQRRISCACQTSGSWHSSIRCGRWSAVQGSRHSTTQHDSNTAAAGSEDWGVESATPGLCAEFRGSQSCWFKLQFLNYWRRSNCKCVGRLLIRSCLMFIDSTSLSASITFN